MKIKKIADEIFKAPTMNELLERWITYANLKKNQDGTYDCDKEVHIDNNIILSRSGKLVIKFNHVRGSFICSKMEMTSLEGCPKIVDGYFDCCLNNLLSLKGAPQKVKGFFDCRENKKKFTQEEVKAVCDVGGTIYAFIKVTAANDTGSNRKNGTYSFI